MKCEICGKADAKTAVRKKVDGKERELYVCLECAAKTEHCGKDDAHGHGVHNGLDMMQELIKALPPPEAMGDFLKEIFEPSEITTKILGNPTAPLPGEAICSGCGMTSADFDRIGRLGCPKCYEAFKDRLRPMIRDMHPGVSHAGKVPPLQEKANGGGL